jgi:DNA polymerase-1
MSLYGGVELPGRPDLENCRRLDLLPIPMISRMERLGVAIDLDYLAALGSQISAEMVDLQRDISSYIPPEALDRFVAASTTDETGEDIPVELNANSADQIRVLLYDLLNVHAGKKIKVTTGGKLSTGKRQLELCRESHPVVMKVLDYRERSKLKSAFCDSLPKFTRFHPRGLCCPVCELSHDTDQTRVHGQILTTRAATGRLSMKKPNLQQIPTRSELGQRIRAAFIAPPGKRLVSVDFSQIELRDLAHLSNCASMLAVYAADGDLHDDTCHRALGVPWDEKPDKYKHRMAAKRVNFGIQNGTTEKGLYLQLVMDYHMNKLEVPEWLTEDWCKWFIEQWLDSRPEVREYFDLQWYRGRRYRCVWDSFGRIRLIPELQSCHSYIRQEGLRQSQNMPVTSTAAGHLKLVMGELEEEFVRLYDEGTYVWPLLPIHDQVIAESDEEDAECIGEIMSYVFSNVMVDKQSGESLWRVPIKADAEILERWTKS